MGLSARDLINKTTQPERVLRLCLDGQLRGEHDALNAEMEALRPPGLGKLANSNPRLLELAQQIQELEDRMAAESVVFRFRAVNHWRLKEIQKQFPTEEKGLAWDVDAASPTLIAECLFDPKFTVDEVRELLERGNQRLADDLFNAAWGICNQDNSVPKSVRASALTAGSGAR